MPIVSRYIAYNGRPVTKVITPSGITAYVADEIPLEALQAWYLQLCEELGVTPDARVARKGPTLGDGECGPKPR